MCVPVPATEGLKLPPLTPGPLYVPPVGVPPVNANAGALRHTDEFDGQVTVGNGLTVKTLDAETGVGQPVLTVYVILVVPADRAVTKPDDNPTVATVGFELVQAPPASPPVLV